MDQLSTDGRLARVPAKRKVRAAVLLEVVPRVEPGRVYAEPEVNQILLRVHDDVAYLRRALDCRTLRGHSGAMTAGIDPEVAPSGTGCVECDADGGWWVHLRRCAQCGHIGCCDSSPSQHATAHHGSTGHPVMQSFEPGEEWFWDFDRSVGLVGPRLADPQHHPEDQPVPGPAGRVPQDWQDHIH